MSINCFFRSSVLWYASAAVHSSLPIAMMCTYLLLPVKSTLSLSLVVYIPVTTDLLLLLHVEFISISVFVSVTMS